MVCEGGLPKRELLFMNGRAPINFMNTAKQLCRRGKGKPHTYLPCAMLPQSLPRIPGRSLTYSLLLLAVQKQPKG